MTYNLAQSCADKNVKNVLMLIRSACRRNCLHIVCTADGSLSLLVLTITCMMFYYYNVLSLDLSGQNLGFSKP